MLVHNISPSALGLDARVMEVVIALLLRVCFCLWYGTVVVSAVSAIIPATSCWDECKLSHSNVLVCCVVIVAVVSVGVETICDYCGMPLQLVVQGQ